MTDNASDQMSISPSSNRRSRSRSPRCQKPQDSDSDDMFVKTPEIKKDPGQIRLGGELEDSKGYYVPQVGEILLDAEVGQRYRINTIKGKGVFSCVVEVQNLETEEKSAIKVLRNNDIMLKSGEKEVKILRRLNSNDPHDRRHIVKLQGSFFFQGHLCIKFEALGMNLREVLLKYGNNAGLSLAAVKSFAKQGFIALYHIRNQQIIHADSN